MAEDKQFESERACPNLGSSCVGSWLDHKCSPTVLAMPRPRKSIALTPLSFSFGTLFNRNQPREMDCDWSKLFNRREKRAPLILPALRIYQSASSIIWDSAEGAEGVVSLANDAQLLFGQCLPHTSVTDD